MREKDMTERWRDFHDSLFVRMMTGSWHEKFVAFATRGLTPNSPLSHRLFRVFIVVIVAAAFIAAAWLLEREIGRIAARGLSGGPRA